MIAASLLLAAALAAEAVPAEAGTPVAPVAPAAAPAVEAGTVAAPDAALPVPRTVRVTSDRASYLRKDGVIQFVGRVNVEDVEFKMHADEVTLFLAGTNDLRRVVALGNVAVTNDCRWGTAAKASYDKANARVVLYGDERAGILARLVDGGKRRSEVTGRKIVFWIDTEQVEVEQSTVTVDAGAAKGEGGLKSLIGK